MEVAQAPASVHAFNLVDAPPNRWFAIFLILVGSLASTIVLKFGQVQYLEVIYFAQMVVVFVLFARRKFRTIWFRRFLWIGLLYACFCVGALALAFASLRFDFDLPATLPPLKYPVVITMSRIAELVASVFAMLWLADEFRRKPASLRFTMRIYFWTGVASAVYSVLTWPLNLLGIASLGVYNDNHRFRGFYNEGGPWGLYVLSLILVGTALTRTRWEPRRRILFAELLLAFALLMSGSKAAVLATSALLLFNGLFSGSAKRRLAVIAAMAAVLFISTRLMNLNVVLRALVNSRQTYERLSHLHANDGNYVVGRVAGLFIVPRMIAAHPLTGIGWGNYGILRNRPEFRGAATWVAYTDEAGLGIIGTAADLGLPLISFLLVILFLPLIYVSRLRPPAYLINLALLQPLVHLFGAQLNLTYPWIVTAFALGLAYSDSTTQRSSTPGAALQVS